MPGVKGKSGGHNKKPTALRRLEGNPGRRPLPPELGPVHDVHVVPVPKPPRSLSKEAKKEWKRLAPRLHVLGLLRAVDEDALGMYCEAFATWRNALDETRRMGVVVANPGTGLPMVNPYCKLAFKVQRDMLKLLSEFGMTPSSRARIETAAAQEPAHETSEKNKAGGVWADLIP